MTKGGIDDTEPTEGDHRDVEEAQPATKEATPTKGEVEVSALAEASGPTRFMTTKHNGLYPCFLLILSAIILLIVVVVIVVFVVDEDSDDEATEEQNWND